MIKNTYKIDYQLKRDEQGRQMLFVSSYQNNIKIEDHFAGYIDDILTENKKQKEVIDNLKDKLIKYFEVGGDCYFYVLTRDKSAFNYGTMSFDDFKEFSEEQIDDIIDFLKEVE